MTSGRPLKLLLVEDNPADQEIARRVISSAKGRCTLQTADDGQAALEYLEIGELPDLVLMDINMPRLSGFEALRRMKENGALCHIPVMMLTTSPQESDVLEAYRLGCSSYVLKPVDIPQFSSMLLLMLDYWTKVATLTGRVRLLGELP